jgi:hypothetical protein
MTASRLAYAADRENSSTNHRALSSTTMVTFHPSLAHTRALAIAISELSRFILTVSLSLSATISNRM